MSTKHEEEEKVPLPTEVNALQEIIDDLWDQYFNPKTPLKAPEKRALMAKYNEAAVKMNEITGFSRVIILTPSTLVTKKKQNEPAETTETTVHVNKPEGKPVPYVSASKSNADKSTSDAAPEKKSPTILKSEPGKIDKILALHKEGKTNKEIIAMGYNKSTVGRQVAEYKKRQSESQTTNPSDNGQPKTP